MPTTLERRPHAPAARIPLPPPAPRLMLPPPPRDATPTPLDASEFWARLGL